MKLKNWKLEREADGVTWAILDTANSSTNTLGAEVMTELGLILDECEKNPPKGLIFKSAKEAGFIAGANIEEFTTADTPAEGPRHHRARLGCLQPAGRRQVPDAGAGARPLHGRRH